MLVAPLRGQPGRLRGQPFRMRGETALLSVLASPSRALEFAQIAELDPDDDEEHREHEERDRRALSEEARGYADLIGVRRQEMGGVRGTSAGQDVDQLEVGEGLDDRENDQDRKSTRLNSSHANISY